MSEPKEGLLTFRAEGNNFRGSRYYSRVIHWPGNASACQGDASGVTIERGFDMGSRTKAESYSYLIKAGIASESAKKIADGAGLKYCRAENFVTANKRNIEEISEEQQLNLFTMTYSDYFYKAENFYFRRKGKDAVAWRDLDQAIRDVFVDMFYQGRLNPNRVKYFEKNNRSDVIRLIKGNRLLSKDEAGRNRIGYLLGEGA